MSDGVGSAYTITSQGNELTYGQFKLHKDATVYQAELIALEMAAKRLAELNLTGTIHIHTDSLSSLQTLKADHLTSIQSIRTKRALTELARQRRTKVKLYWVKAHVGVEFNERADVLAKGAISQGIPRACEHSRSGLKRQYAKDTIRKWQNKWASTPQDYKRTRLWFPKINAKVSQELLCKSRGHLSTCIQWITGFCNLMRHRHKKNANLSDRCRLCNDGMETPEHLTFHCPRLTNLRTTTMNTFSGMPNEGWKTSWLIKFVTHQLVNDLLTDETPYPRRRRTNV
jgi:ribonuclease HI